MAVSSIKNVTKVHQLPTELHAELMHFLDMKSLRKMLPISRLPCALFGEKMRKWNARNEWTYPWWGDEVRQRRIFEISNHGFRVCKGNDQMFANVRAKNPFNLGRNGIPAATTILRFYFEIRINKSTGPILFGLIGQHFELQMISGWSLYPHGGYYEYFAMQHHHGGSIRSEVLQLSSKVLWRQHQYFLANDISAWPPTGMNRHPHLDLVPAAAEVAGAVKFADGDVLGCGLLQFPQISQQQQLFFTKNGQLFGEPICWLSPNNHDELLLFPFVGLVNEGTIMSANFGDSIKFPFLYDIEQHNSPIKSNSEVSPLKSVSPINPLT